LGRTPTKSCCAAIRKRGAEGGGVPVGQGGGGCPSASSEGAHG
jgi:hypothetical protein